MRLMFNQFYLFHKMAGLYSDPKIPNYIYILGLLGIICLVVALISFIIFFTVYHEKIDTSVSPFNGGSVGYRATNLITIIFTSVGTFFCLFILYGHVLKQRRDPQMIFGPRSYIEFPETGEFTEIEKETSQVYSGKLSGVPELPTSNYRLNTDFL